MSKVLILCFLFFVSVWCSFATNIGVSDTLSVNKSALSVLLKSKAHIKRVNYLNKLYAPTNTQLKSYSNETELDSIVTSVWNDETQLIEKSQLFTCTFENNGSDVLVDIFKWDTEEKKWVVADHNYYYFDTKNRLSEIEFEEYVTAEYRLITRVVYQYEGNLLAYESRYDRIDEEVTWNELEQFEYTYNNDSTLRTVYVKKWDSYEKAWMTESYETYTYDSIGNVALKTGFNYDYFDNESTKKYELRYTYNEDKQLTEEVKYIPGWEVGPFVPDQKQAIIYDDNTEIESKTFYVWDFDADNWVGTVRQTYSAAVEGSQIYENTSFLWSKENQKWEGSQSSAFYSNNYRLASEVKNWDFIETYMPAYAFNGVVCDEIISSAWESYQWNKSGESNYYFSDDAVVGIDDLASFSYKVYPNPVSDLLNVETNNNTEITCIVRNANGSIVLNSNGSDKMQLNLSSLSSGFYFLEVIQENQKIHIQKIIKR